MKNISCIYDTEIEELAIGKFDGVHVAHQMLLENLGARGGVLMVLVEGEEFLSDMRLREELIARAIFPLGLEEIRGFSGEEFLAFLSHAFPKLKKLVVGYDFCFGRARSCGVEELKAGFSGEVVVVGEVCCGGLSVHTQTIKLALKEGRVGEANLLLGRFYQIRGRVVAGQGLGKRELYPTINLENQGFLLPKDGVYATLFGKERCESVSFLGVRSTDGKFSIEVHVLEGDSREGILALEQGELVDLFFIERLRDNARFSDLALLKEQIARDRAQARSILQNRAGF